MRSDNVMLIIIGPWAGAFRPYEGRAGPDAQDQFAKPRETSSPLHKRFGLLPRRANNFFWRGPFLVPVQAPLFDLVVQHCCESSIGSWYC